jgi:hypothetical protein
MKPVSVTIIIAVGGMLSVAGPAPARADVIGNIQVCYFCNNNFGQGVQDGPIFELNNTSTTAITGATFTANGDAFNVGTIPALGSVILIPGVSSDGSAHSGFWHVTGSILDTSDVGPDANNTPFSFMGLQGLLTASTGAFTPATSASSQNKSPVAQIANSGDTPIVGFIFEGTELPNQYGGTDLYYVKNGEWFVMRTKTKPQVPDYVTNEPVKFYADPKDGFYAVGNDGEKWWLRPWLRAKPPSKK